MKTIALSLVALAAVAGTAFANDRSEDYNAAWRNVNYGAVWADRPVTSDVQAFEVAPVTDEQSDFATRKLRGANFDNDN